MDHNQDSYPPTEELGKDIKWIVHVSSSMSLLLLL